MTKTVGGDRVYELNLDGFVIKNRTLQELRSIISVNHTMPWEIYEVKQSKMNQKMPLGYKLNDSDMEEALERLRKGESKKKVSAHLGVYPETLNKYLKIYAGSI